MKTPSYLQTTVKTSFRYFIKGRTALVALALASIGQAGAQVIIPITNSGFTNSSGQIASQLTLLAGNAAPAQQLGSSGWYGQAAATTAVVVVPVASLRGGVEVNFDSSSSSRGEIYYSVGAGLNNLLGLEMPETSLWQPLGTNFQANTTYTFSVDVTTPTLLNLSLLGQRGFGIGLTSNSSSSSVGTYVADSLTSPGLVNLTLLSGNTQRMTFSYTTGAVAPTGNIGVSIFAGRGNQGITAELLTSFTVDDASLTAVPEPKTALLAGLGLLIVLQGHRFARGLTKKDNAVKA